MSFEAGGRTDKAGNRFETKYFIFQILKVIEEDIRSVTFDRHNKINNRNRI